jgi:hypothetical protein
MHPSLLFQKETVIDVISICPTRATGGTSVYFTFNYLNEYYNAVSIYEYKRKENVANCIACKISAE